MSRVVFSLALIFCVGPGIAWAQEPSRTRPGQPGQDLPGARAPSPTAGQAVRQPAGPPIRRQPVGGRIRRPALEQTQRQPARRPQPARGQVQPRVEGPPHERLVCVLENAPAMDVANTLGKLIQGLRAAGQLPSEVVIVPEVVTNSLVISAAPKELEEIRRLVDQLDRRPASVRVELLIAEVLPSGKAKARSLKQSSAKGGRKARPDVRKQKTPVSDAARLIEESLGAKPAKSNPDIRRRLRALESSGQLKIINRPQLTTLDNQPALIHVGQKIPVLRIVGSREGTRATSLIYEQVGLIVGLTPRISPRGVVTMEIDVEKSEVGPIAQSVPAGVLDSGKVLRLPRIEGTTLQTTVSVPDGESVVLGGLTVESGAQRSRLMIVLTPHIIKPK